MHKHTAVVTGAATGVGKAVALMLASRGWLVACVGRREGALQEMIHASGELAARLLACPCDVASPEAVESMRHRVNGLFERVDVLINAAGTNVPKRNLADLTFGNYQHILETNLTGAYLCVQAFLPQMRERRSGTIVNIVSDAGKTANAKAGPAYVASKFGLAGLTQAINCEERAHGVRACGIFPGDIDTPLLEKRPAPPLPEARALMLQPEDVAECVWLAVNLPARAVVEEILVRPR